jgi:thiol-disulfide isomerase/thioredoxin
MSDTQLELASSEERYQFLRDEGVLVQNDDGTVAVTEAYDARRGVYHDTYADADDEQFHETLADLFGLSRAEARDRAERLGITRGELVAYLTLRAYFDDVAPERELSPTTLVQMAGMVADIDPVSPVPETMAELTDDDYETFLADHDDAVVFVWKRHCEPCDEMKAELDEIREAASERVALAGVDGERVDAFRREFDVDAAPATLTFADGAFVQKEAGRRSPDQLAELFASAFR